MSIENIGECPFFDLAVKHLLPDVVVRTKPKIDLGKRPSANGGDKFENLTFDMFSPAKEIFGKGSAQPEDDR